VDTNTHHQFFVITNQNSIILTEKMNRLDQQKKS